MPPLQQQATVVTAYYPIRSKFPPQQYMEWANRFLQLTAPIVFFTEPHLIPTFQTIRSANIRYTPRPFTDLDVWRLYKDEWVRDHTNDHERTHHSPELYAVWASKAFLMEEAAAMNPFATDYFFWCDVGAFRDPAISPAILATFPDSVRLATNVGTSKILLTSVEGLGGQGDLTRSFDHTGGLKPLEAFRYVNRIVGGLWGGHRGAIPVWRSAYEQTLLRFFQAGAFAGKDQSAMLMAALAYPELVEIVEPTVGGDRWFFSQRLLSAEAAPWRRDVSYIAPLPPPTVTIEVTGGLGNQLFQCAAAYSYAKATGRRLVILPHKQAPTDTQRSTYWDSVLGRLGHCLTAPASYPPPMHLTYHHYEQGPTHWSPLPSQNIAHVPNIHLHGYFQSPRYHDPEILRLLRPSVKVLRAVEAMFGSLLEQRERVVVVHARRTDYLKSPAAITHHGPLPAAYYTEAIQRMLTKFQTSSTQPLFLFTSDDPTFWWTDVLPVCPPCDFQILMEDNDVLLFTLLQQFRHFILANSTFSWWAATLAERTETVIAPRNWFGPTGPQRWQELYDDSWITI